MNQTHLTYIETTSPYSPSDTRARRWQCHFEACCWVHLAQHCSRDTDLLFCLDYVDSLKKYSLVIDRTRLAYMCDRLMAGRLLLEGFGAFKEARLSLLSDVEAPSFDVKQLRFRVLNTSGSAPYVPRYGSVA